MYAGPRTEERGGLGSATDLIAEGEAVRRDLHEWLTEEGRLRVAVIAFLVRAREVVGDELPGAVAMLEAEAPHEGRRAGVDHLLAIVEPDLVALYDIRRQLARRESGEES